MEGFGVVAGEVGGETWPFFPCTVRCGVLGCENYVVTILTLLHPFANPRLGLLVLVVVGRVDEIAAGIIVSIEELEAVVFRHAAHEALPCGPD